MAIIANAALVGIKCEILYLVWGDYSCPIYTLEVLLMKYDKTQLERFKDAARELEADDDETKFNEKLCKLVRQKPDAKKDD